MKKIMLTVTLILAVALITPAFAGVGTLAKSKVYSVNVIAYENCPKAENSQRISVLAGFKDNPTGQTLVSLNKTNKIFLAPGDTFRVLSSNACNPFNNYVCGDTNTAGACLQLPPDSATQYEVWVRLVGPPDSQIDPYLCAVDPAQNNTIVCSTDHVVKTRLTGKGEPSFTNYTKSLLYIGSTPLFDASLQNYFWSWDTTGKPHAQVWFVQPLN
jgi:hypothetical protein